LIAVPSGYPHGTVRGTNHRAQLRSVEAGFDRTVFCTKRSDPRAVRRDKVEGEPEYLRESFRLGNQQGVTPQADRLPGLHRNFEGLAAHVLAIRPVRCRHSTDRMLDEKGVSLHQHQTDISILSGTFPYPADRAHDVPRGRVDLDDHTIGSANCEEIAPAT